MKTLFTLVELLIVIAVIAILSSLLLPALGNARESGKRIYCVNTLKQCGYAAVQYTDDWNGFIADYHSPSVNAEGSWTVKLAPYYNIDPKPSSAYYPFKPGNNPLVSKHFCCVKRPQGNFYGNNSSYFINSYTGDSATLKPLKLSAFPQPSGKVYLGDAADANMNFQVNDFSYNRYFVEGETSATTAVVGGSIQLRHQRKANFVFLDSHAASYGADALPAATWTTDCSKWLQPDYPIPDKL